VDGTFLKGKGGGILLVACAKDTGNKIFIIAVASVSIENQENWQWFLSCISQWIVTPPFVISDREKGLINAVNSVFPSTDHFFCFRHIMENMIVKFKHSNGAPQRKSKGFWNNIRSKCWALARSMTKQEFDTSSNLLQSDPLGKEIYNWLEEIGFSKFVLYDAVVARHGILTSNNVESINARLSNIRKLPILDLLRQIEIVVIVDRYLRYAKIEATDTLLTKYAANRVTKMAKLLEQCNFSATCIGSMKFMVNDGTGKTFETHLNTDGCTCGFSSHHSFPCLHMMFVAKNVSVNLSSLIPHEWHRETYLNGYKECSNGTVLVAMNEIVKETMRPPNIERKRGRPRVKRLRSTAELEVSTDSKRSYRCAKCKEIGHNKASCNK
jgi:hypothetical protein